MLESNEKYSHENLKTIPQKSNNEIPTFDFHDFVFRNFVFWIT